MSEENVEIVRRSYEALPEALSSGSADSWLEFFDPEVEWIPPPAWAALEVGDHAEAQVLHGHAGIRRFLEKTGEMWDEQEVEPERFLDAGDRVLVLVRLRVRGRDGVELDEPWAHLITLRNGKVTRMELYPDRSEALEAAGLSE